MSIFNSPPPTVAEMLERIGDVSPERILLQPPLGTATPEDALRATETGQPCELVDGVLVTKASHGVTGRLSPLIGAAIAAYLEHNDIGIVSGTKGLIQFGPMLARSASVAFTPYENISPDADPATPMPDWVPALAVEVISPGNTRREIERKLRDYFTAGVKLVWCVYPKSRTVRAYTGTDQSREYGDTEMLDGGTILPGFTLPVGPLFDRAINIRKPQ